jgi:hypothetical protein
MARISIEDLYTKCSICGAEIRVYEPCFYKGMIRDDLIIENSYIYCSLKCLEKEVSEE